MKKALFFDLDGTLWDALVPIMDSWNKAMEDNNKKYRFTKESLQKCMGLTPEETVDLYFNDVPFNEGMELFKICLNAEIKYLSENPGTLYPNEVEVLRRLAAKYPLYVVSNADKGYIENYLKVDNINELFKGHLCAGDTNKDKWENILFLKDKENIDEVIYIGDTMKDMEQCKRANVPFIHAAYGFGIIESVQHKINNLLELEEEVSKIFNN